MVDGFMLTIFSIPKPFRGHIGVIQNNAIGSWRHLGRDIRIILIGRDEGVERAAEEYGALHIPDVACTEYGTPLLSSAFAAARGRAATDVLCYSNADIMFTGDLVRAVERISFRRFLMIGQRWDVDIRAPWSLSTPDWEHNLRRLCQEEGRLRYVNAIDYFVFRRSDDVFTLPPFAVGRPGWDNWLIHHARSNDRPVIDATEEVLVVHQMHDYAHVPERTGPQWDGPEASRNRAIAGEHGFDILDSTHVLSASGIRKARSARYVWRRAGRVQQYGRHPSGLLPGWKLRFLYCWAFPQAKVWGGHQSKV